MYPKYVVPSKIFKVYASPFLPLPRIMQLRVCQADLSSGRTLFLTSALLFSYHNEKHHLHIDSNA